MGVCLVERHTLSQCPENKKGTMPLRCQLCNRTHSNLNGCHSETSHKKPGHKINFITQSPNYSRTCPVSLYHPQARCRIRGLAVIDDQSTITFMDPWAIDRMGLPQSELMHGTLATVTVQGTSQADPCQLVNGLIVAPMDSPEKEIRLPTTHIQHALPCSLREVPTQAEVAKMPGFEHLAHHFQNGERSWRTILLIGRDCATAQRQEQIVSDRNP